MSLETILSNVEKTGKDQSESIEETTKKEIAEKLLETKKVGREIEKTINTPLFYIYSNGEVEKKIFIN